MSKLSPRDRGFVYVISLFSVFSVLLLGTAWYVSSLAPSMMVRNYRTVKYAAEMQGALTAIYIDASSGKEPDSLQLSRFEENLEKQKHNITELREPEITAAVEQQWSTFAKKPITPDLESFKKLGATLQELVSLNETAMHAHEQQALTIGKGVLFGGILGFVLVLIYSVQFVLQQES